MLPNTDMSSLLTDSYLLFHMSMNILMNNHNYAKHTA